MHALDPFRANKYSRHVQMLEHRIFQSDCTNAVSRSGTCVFTNKGETVINARFARSAIHRISCKATPTPSLQSDYGQQPSTNLTEIGIQLYDVNRPQNVT